MRLTLLFLLCVGLVWGAFALWLFLILGGIAEIDSPGYALFYWAGMLVGPLMLTSGAVMLLAGWSLRLGGILVLLGCVTLTVFSTYNTVVGMRRGPLEAPPVVWFYVVLLAVMFAADYAGFTVLRHSGSARSETR
jgi:hypothetical protein